MEDVQTHTADAPAAPVAPAETKPAAETPDAAAIEARLRADGQVLDHAPPTRAPGL